MELKQSKLWHASQKNPSAIRPISTVRQEIEYSTYYKREDQTRPWDLYLRKKKPGYKDPL